MALGATLADMRLELLAETGQSLNVAQTVNAVGHYNHALKRTQEEQWRCFAWPHLRLFKDVTLQAGQRYYAYPPGLPFDAIDRIWRKEGDEFFPIEYGITPLNYTAMGGEDRRAWPLERWRNVPVYDETTQQTNPCAEFEVWPTPDMNGTIRVEGQAPLNPLVSDADKCVIDSTLIVLYAAAELLASAKSEAASLKLQKAQQYQRKLMTNLGSVKRRTRSLSAYGGSTTTGIYAGARPWIDYIPGR